MMWGICEFQHSHTILKAIFDSLIFFIEPGFNALARLNNIEKKVSWKDLDYNFMDL
jgi:hypothetical protein